MKMTQSQASSISARDDLRTEPRLVRGIIIAIAVIFLTIFVVLPLVVVFAQAFSKGVGAYFAALSDPEALSAIRLTLMVAAISVSLNLVFGLVAAWAIAKFEFRGKTFLISLIDLPFSVSPVVSGLVFVLLFGAQGYWGPWLQAHNIHVLFAVPGIALATIFEFGAVSVVSGHIRGETNTMPLQVEILYNEYQFVSSFAIASLLAMLALITLVAKTILERHLDEGPLPSGD